MSEQITALKLDNVVKTYGTGDFSVRALKGVNLSFRKNEFVAILGPSGCGKTTMLNIIGGLDRYTSGDLIINGKSTKEYKDADWDRYRNNSIGFVFQSYNLIPHQTILGNVELALELSGINKAERKNRALKMLEKVGLKGLEHKKPNQLSGGQMQRVAIARALINDPEIILADEPTGALDTETSVQVMDLLKEVAKDRLVIMVTHNPELAEKYATRIINLLDGEVVGDSNPANYLEEKDKTTKRKPRMGLKTAFALSLKNLFSKRARTILTSVAGSIGIIGIALVLAISNGFNIYMSRMQTDTLATYPLTISESSVDLSSFSEMYENELKDAYPELNNILVKSAFHKLTGMLQSNDLTDSSENGFRHYLEQMDKELYYSVQYDYGFDMNDYFYTHIKMNGTEQFLAIDQLVSQIEKKYDDQLQSAMGLNTGFVRQFVPTIQEMPDDPNLIAEQYDMLYRVDDSVSFDSLAPNQILLVVNKYNQISDITLALLGYLEVNVETSGNNVNISFGDKTEIPLDEIIGEGIYLADNSKMYQKRMGVWFPKVVDESIAEKLEVVGVIREKEHVDGILNVGLAYTSALTEKVLRLNKDSEIATDAKNSESKSVTVMMPNGEGGTEVYETLSVRQLCGVDTPSEIKIYAKDFEKKEKIKAYIDEWNDAHSDDDNLQITYSDTMSMMFGMLNTMVDAVTYILVAFTSISLVVSSVMIGIITYISVVERTKEIGVLRSLGASKHEISNVFNAETFLIGMFSGLFGVAVTYLLSIPINLIIGIFVPEIGAVANLNPLAALILVLISITLTLISGLIPSRIAANKDPVVALRSE